MKSKNARRAHLFDVRAQAGAILAEEGNRLLLIEALILCLPLVMLHLFLDAVFYVLSAILPQIPSPIFEWVGFGVSVLLLLCVTRPALLGVFGIAARLERGKRVVLTDLFLPFSSRAGYARALAASVRLTPVFVLVDLLLQGSAYLSASLLPAGLPATAANVTLSALALLLGLVLLLRRFDLPARAYAEESGTSAGGVRRMCRTRDAFAFLWGYLPRILLGILTLGVLLLIDVIPQMLLAYFRFCRYQSEMTIQSEEYRK